MVYCASTHPFGLLATGVRQTASTATRRHLLAAVPLVLAVSLLGQGSARGQTIVATSAQDYATAITDANASSGGPVIVIDNVPGTVISLGGAMLPSLTGGTLQVGNGSIDTPFTGGTITDNAALSFKPPGAANDTISTTISGTGTVTQNGPGTITFTDNGTNTYSGGTTIAGGTLTLGDGTTNVGTLGSGQVTNNSALVFNEPSAVTFANTISGSGTVTQNGPGTVTFTDNATNTYSGGTTIAGGTVSLGDGSTNTGTLGSGQVTNNSALVFNEPSAVTFGNAISGTGTVTQSGPGTVTFTDNGSNSYSGGTTIASGSTLTLGDGSANTGTMGSGAVSNNGALVFNQPSLVTIANSISGTGTVTQQDIPGVTLSGSNSYSGGTTVIGNNNVGTSFVFGYYGQQNDYGVLQLANEGALSPNTTITLQQAGGLVAGYALDQTTLNAISSTSVGFVALGADSGNDLDFTNLPQVSLGADGLAIIRIYSGNLTPTPPGSTSLSTVNYQYQVGGGNGFLVLNTGLGDFFNGQTITAAEVDAVNNGFTILEGFNTFTGGMNVSLGVVELASTNAYCNLNPDCQTDPPIQIARTGVLATGYSLDQPTLDTITSSSNGTVALGVNSSNDLDFTNLPNVSLGAVGTYTYSGTITPGSNGYLLGGGGDFRVTSDLTVTQLLTGNNALTVNAPGFDPGTVTLVNDETYTGNTTINGGTLQLGNGTTNGTIADSPLVTITNTAEGNGYLAFQEATAITFANPITGTGNVQQFGPGTVTLTQSETYTGSTTIYGGTLALAAGSSIEPSAYVAMVSNVSGNNPAVLDISQGGNQTVQNLQSVWNGSTGPVTAQVLLGANTLTDIANSGATAFDGVISGTGAFVKQGSQQLTFSNVNTYSGGTTISAGTLVLGGQVPSAPTWTVGTAGTGPVTDNAALVFYEPSPVTLGNAIGGTGTVTQAGPGTVTLSGTNTYSGGTSIGGTFTLALGGQAPGAPTATVGTLGSGGVANSGTLVFTEPSAVTLPNLISGLGTVTQDGPGTVTLSAVNTYSGGTTITAGTLALGAGTIGGLGSGAVTDNGTLQFTEPGAVTFGNVISGSGGVTQTGPGAVALSATNSYSGPTTIGSGAALVLGASTVGTPGGGSVADSGTLVFAEPGAVTFGNLISGSGGVEQDGPGTVTLTNAESYTGGTLIFSGTLALGAGGSISSSSAVTLASTNASGGFGVLDISAAGNQTVNNLSSAWYSASGTAAASVVLGSNTLTANATSATVFDGVISGTGGLTKTGTATLTLAGGNTYAGVTTISAGTLALGGQAAGAPAATVGTLGSGTVTDNANLAFTEPSAITFGNVISGTGTVTQDGPGTVTLNSTNSYTGGTIITAGTLALGTSAVVSALTLGSPVGGLALGGSRVGTVGPGPITDNGTLAFTEPSAITFTNVISGSGGVTQSGPGTITLNGASTYTGLTEVVAGTLIVGSSAGNGASVGGSVLVDAGATLAGYGTLGVGQPDPPTLTNNGTVIPGDVSGSAVGTLSVAGNYVQGSAGNLLIAVTPTQASQLRVGGSATLAGTITFAYAPGTYVPITYTVLAANGPISGRFGTVAEQGAIPTALTRTVEYIASASDPVLLVLGNQAVLAPADDSIFSEQLSSLTALADSAAATLLDGGTAANDCPMGGVPPAPSGSGAASTASADIAALARVICGKGGWIHADGTFLGVDGSGGYPNYHANTAGFLAGIDRPVGDGGLRLGIAAGYDHRWLTDSAGASATADVARFGVYAIQPVGPVVLNAAFLYGRDWDTTNRPTGIGTATAQYGGNEFAGGVRASLPMTLGGFTAVPMGGVRFASVGGSSFTESGAGALSGFGVSGASETQLSVIPYARFVVSRDFVMASGMTLSPYAAIGYQYQAGTTEQPVLLTASDATTFNAGSASLDRSAATLGIGVAAGQGNWSVFAAYGALVSGNWQEQEVNVGVRVDF